MGRETALMRPDDGGEIVPGVFAVRQGYVNAWFVRGPDGWIAVDTGTDPKSLAAEMGRLRIDPASVKAVLLTHSDYDHAGGLSALAGIPLFIGENEERMVDGSIARAAFVRNGRLPAHRTLPDGGSAALAGLAVSAYNVPGHTPGSTVFLIGPGLLFVGDAMSIADGRMSAFNAFFNMDSSLALRSQSKLRGLSGVKAVFTAHYGHSTDPARLFAPAP
jgi:glyoxylase-like metal-dependent hydrolase (beta-lactamase superfamily II)